MASHGPVTAPTSEPGRWGEKRPDSAGGAGPQLGSGASRAPHCAERGCVVRETGLRSGPSAGCRVLGPWDKSPHSRCIVT